MVGWSNKKFFNILTLLQDAISWLHLQIQLNSVLPTFHVLRTTFENYIFTIFKLRYLQFFANSIIFFNKLIEAVGNTVSIAVSKYHTPVLCHSLIFCQEGVETRGIFTLRIQFFVEPTLMLRWENSSLISIFMACLKGLGGLRGVDCICTLLDYRQELSDLAVKTSCKKGSNNIDYVLIHLIFFVSARKHSPIKKLR